MSPPLTLYQLADLLDSDLHIKRHANNDVVRFVCQLHCVTTKEHKNSFVETYTYGNGNSPEESMEDYVRKLRGCIVIYHNKDDASITKLHVPENLVLFLPEKKKKKKT